MVVRDASYRLLIFPWSNMSGLFLLGYFVFYFGELYEKGQSLQDVS